MTSPRDDMWQFRLLCVVAVGVTAIWALTLHPGLVTPELAQLSSNLGLIVAPVAAALGAFLRARGASGDIRRFWIYLGVASLSWGLGQTIWTWYESVLGREVPFPSLADVGYLGLPPFATAALLCLPLAAETFAGRVRSVLDGLMVAASLLLCSWVLVLDPVFSAGGDSVSGQVISLAYPIGDVVVITLVIYTAMRQRRLNRGLSVSLPLVGCGLVAITVADSGFVYLTTTGAYSSGSGIDIGWFAGFVILLLAARRPMKAFTEEEAPATDSYQLGIILPYTAVSVALLTSVIEVLRSGSPDLFITWTRTVIIGLLVTRQVLTLRENHSLTRNLEDRVASRTLELHASRERFAALVAHSFDVVTVVDREGYITYQSDSSQRVLGYPPADFVGRPAGDLVDDDGDSRAFLEAVRYTAAQPLRIHTISSTWRCNSGRCNVEVTMTNLLDHPDVRGVVLNTRNVTDRKVLEDQLVHQAFHDSLTGLANRALFKDRLVHALSRRDASDGSISVLFIDLDGFKKVNDTLGHGSGDAVLVQVAERLASQVRASDTVARIGGDEFAVLVEDAPGADIAYTSTLAERFVDSLQEPFLLGAERVHLGGSIGIAGFDEQVEDAEQLLRNADLAMYQAKSIGDGGYAFYDPSMHEGLVDRVRLEFDLRRALEAGEFEVHYQPLVSLRSGVITGMEALLRWNHPERGLISPHQFIPLAEASGLIRALGLWVLREACRQTVEWQRTSGLPQLRINVNMSARQLRQVELLEQLREVLADTGLPPDTLVLEMTESVLMDNSEATLDALNRVSALGVHLAIDDFGTGYSSLSYLHRFPVDVLKIDRSFIEQLSNGGDGALVRSIVRLAQSMRMETVAEGIQHPQEVLLLRRQGCTTGQGYHFSPPVPADTATRLLAEQQDLTSIPSQRKSGVVA